MQKALRALLTSYIVNGMRDQMTAQRLLELLTTNSETPYFLWHNGTRAELQAFLERMQQPQAEVARFL